MSKTSTLRTGTSKHYSAVTKYAEKHNADPRNRSIQIETINETAIVSLFKIYEAAFALFDLKDLESWIDHLMLLLEKYISFEVTQDENDVDAMEMRNMTYTFRTLIISFVQMNAGVSEFKESTKQFSKQ